MGNKREGSLLVKEKELLVGIYQAIPARTSDKDRMRVKLLGR
jgi:hypothetical protein